MNSDKFTSWLKGFLDAIDGDINKDQAARVYKELAVTFKDAWYKPRTTIEDFDLKKEEALIRAEEKSIRQKKEANNKKAVSDLIKRKAEANKWVHRGTVTPSTKISDNDTMPVKLSAEEVAQIKKTFDEAVSKVPKPTMRGGFIPTCHHCSPRFGK